MSKIIKITDTVYDEKNHNLHTDVGMRDLEYSIDTVGVIESVTVSNDNKVITGNARKTIMDRKFKQKNAIIVETDGTRPVIIKRTDIKSNTKQFYKASILANTTAKTNINIDMEKVQELSQEYGFGMEEVGLEPIVLEEPDYSILGDNTASAADGIAANVKRALQIEFTPEDYLVAFELCKTCREHDINIGTILIAELKKVTKKLK